MVEALHTHEAFCNVCSHVWPVEGSTFRAAPRPSALAPRFSSLDDFIRRTGIRRDEVATLASIGALNAFGFDRRTALWQIEQAIRPAGELFEEARNSDSQLPTSNSQLPNPNSQLPNPHSQSSNLEPPTSNLEPPTSSVAPPASPLAPMTVPERLLADYAGTSLTIGPHPMSLRRSELALRGVLRASDLPLGRHGRRVRVAGAVITRQRPGTAKGFVFLTLEDETGIANIIVRPDLFAEQRAHVVGAPYLLVEGTLQIQEGVTSVRAERVHPLGGASPPVDSHDFR
jgi:error-prone DNA polymerase